MRICAFSLWPAPTIVFFTRFGAYSATGRPAIAGTHTAMPRAWPLLSGATGACGGVLGGAPRRAPLLLERRTRPASSEAQPVAVERHHAPAGAAKPGIDAEDPNQVAHDRPLIAPPAATA